LARKHGAVFLEERFNGGFVLEGKVYPREAAMMEDGQPLLKPDFDEMKFHPDHVKIALRYPQKAFLMPVNLAYMLQHEIDKHTHSL
jgi:hypothetical protein